jgi:hypothetical protein
MSENPPSGPFHGHAVSGFPSAAPPTGFNPAPGGPPPWQAAPPRGQSGRGLTYAALATALLAAVLAIVGWFRPSPPPAPAHAAAPTYSEQQIADAKTRACTALKIVQKGVGMHAGTGPEAQASNDPTMAEAQSANARLAIISGAWYLRDHLDPAAPPPLADAIRHLSDNLLDLGESYLAGLRNDDPTQSQLIKDGNSGFDRALELCR